MKFAAAFALVSVAAVSACGGDKGHGGDNTTPDKPTGTKCTATATATIFGSKVDGCPQDCPYEENCIGDGGVLLPCGCTEAVALETKTTTVCVTRTNCFNCHENFGLVYTTPTNCPDA